MQEKTEKTLLPDSDLEGGKVRPGSKVYILTLDSEFHRLPYTVEEVHPALADKLVEAGKAQLWSKGKKLPDEYKEANDAAIKAKARKPKKGKGRTPDAGASNKNLSDTKGGSSAPTETNDEIDL